MSISGELLDTDSFGIRYYLVDNKDNLAEGCLEVFIVYNKTNKDYPGQYYLLRNVVKKGCVCIDRAPLIVSKTLKELRRKIPYGKAKDSSKEKDVDILEVWF